MTFFNYCLFSSLQILLQTHKAPNQTCSKTTMGLANHQSTSKIITDFIKEHLWSYRKCSLKGNRANFQNEFRVAVKDMKVSTAREIAMKDTHDTGELNNITHLLTEMTSLIVFGALHHSLMTSSSHSY